jgi:hypothetical protein
LIQKLSAYFSSIKILFGITSLQKGYSHTIISLDKKRRKTLVSCGRGTAPILGFLFPRIAIADTGSIPVLFTCEEIGDEDPDEWLDRNEERIIPTGITSDQIATECFIHEKSIYCATVKKNDLEKLTKNLPEELIAGSIRVPFWNLASLYSQYIDSEFFI